MSTITTTAVYEIVTCAACGIRFGVPDNYVAQVRRDGGTLNCPNGHGNGWGDSDLDRAQKALVRATQQLDQQKAATAEAKKATEEEHKLRVQAQRSVIAHKATNTKLKKKLAEGACPCCEKLFPDLAGHMATEHPDFEGREEPEGEADANAERRPS